MAETLFSSPVHFPQIAEQNQFVTVSLRHALLFHKRRWHRAQGVCVREDVISYDSLDRTTDKDYVGHFSRIHERLK